MTGPCCWGPSKSIAWDSALEIMMVSILFFLIRAIRYWPVHVFFRLSLSFLPGLLPQVGHLLAATGFCEGHVGTCYFSLAVLYIHCSLSQSFHHTMWWNPEISFQLSSLICSLLRRPEQSVLTGRWVQGCTYILFSLAVCGTLGRFCLIQTHLFVTYSWMSFCM